MKPNEILEKLIVQTKSLHGTLVSMRNSEGVFHELDQDSIRHQLRELYTLSGQLNHPSAQKGHENEIGRAHIEEPEIVVEILDENSGMQTAIHAVLEENVHHTGSTESSIASVESTSITALPEEKDVQTPQAATWPDEPAIHAGLEDVSPAAQANLSPPVPPPTNTPHTQPYEIGHAVHVETEPNKSVADRFTPSETVGDTILKNQPVQRVSDKLRSTPLSDLHESIGINERFAFINQLFKGDQARYFETINRLNASRSQEEALRFLNEELLAGMAWKTPPTAWKEFVELVSRRYQA